MIPFQFPSTSFLLSLFLFPELEIQVRLLPLWVSNRKPCSCATHYLMFDSFWVVQNNCPSLLEYLKQRNSQRTANNGPGDVAVGPDEPMFAGSERRIPTCNRFHDTLDAMPMLEKLSFNCWNSWCHAIEGFFWLSFVPRQNQNIHWYVCHPLPSTSIYSYSISCSCVQYLLPVVRCEPPKTLVLYGFVARYRWGWGTASIEGAGSKWRWNVSLACIAEVRELNMSKSN